MKEGSDCWFTDNPQKFLGDDYNSKDFKQLKDIVEVWFDSGSTTVCTEARKDLKWPADMYLEGSDQQRLVSFFTFRVAELEEHHLIVFYPMDLLSMEKV